MAKAKKSRASKIRYVSQNQLSLVEFEMIKAACNSV